MAVASVIPNSLLFAENVAFNSAMSGNAETDANYTYVPSYDSKGNVIPPISSSQEALIQEAAATSIPTWVWAVGALAVGWWWMSGKKRRFSI